MPGAIFHTRENSDEGIGMVPAQPQNVGAVLPGRTDCPGRTWEGLLTEVSVQGRGSGKGS